MRQPIREGTKVPRHVATVVGVGAGLAASALDRDAAVRLRAGHACREVQIEEFFTERRTVRCVTK